MKTSGPGCSPLTTWLVAIFDTQFPPYIRRDLKMDQQLLELLKEEAFSLGLLAIATPTYEDIVKDNKEILTTPRFLLE